MHPKCALVLVALIVWHSCAVAGEFVAVNVFDEPDALHAWSTSDTLGTEHVLGITLAANYCRGLVLTEPDTGWYVSVFRDVGTPDLTGLYRLKNGVSTRIGPLPYRTPEAWGLALSVDRTHLYYVADQNWTSVGVPYRLYRVDFDGAFTEIGPVVVPGTNDPEIRGLTMNRAENRLYAYDHATDKLLTIDPASAAVSVVGPLGINLETAGAIAFSEDGSELILCFGDGHVARVNPATGHITEIGRLPYIVAALAYLPSPLLGDIDDDGCVSLTDLAMLLTGFGCVDEAPAQCLIDLDSDGDTDLSDLAILLSNFGSGCS